MRKKTKLRCGSPLAATSLFPQGRASKPSKIFLLTGTAQLCQACYGEVCSAPVSFRQDGVNSVLEGGSRHVSPAKSPLSKKGNTRATDPLLTFQPHLGIIFLKP